MKINDIESRFLEITGIKVDLSLDNITKDTPGIQQQETTKEKSKEFGQVFTPLFIVDQMINLELDNLTLDKTTCDLCAGCGQFSIRLLRKLYNKFPKMNVETWLSNKHWFTELQAESCAKLIYIFGKDINMYIGDSLLMNKTSENDKGILFFNPLTDKWENNESFNKILNNKYQTDISELTAIINRVYKYYESLTPIKVSKRKAKNQSQLL